MKTKLWAAKFHTMKRFRDIAVASLPKSVGNTQQTDEVLILWVVPRRSVVKRLIMMSVWIFVWSERRPKTASLCSKYWVFPLISGISNVGTGKNCCPVYINPSSSGQSSAVSYNIEKLPNFRPHQILPPSPVKCKPRGFYLHRLKRKWAGVFIIQDDGSDVEDWLKNSIFEGCDKFRKPLVFAVIVPTKWKR